MKTWTIKPAWWNLTDGPEPSFEVKAPYVKAAGKKAKLLIPKNWPTATSEKPLVRIGCKS